MRSIVSFALMSCLLLALAACGGEQEPPPDPPDAGTQSTAAEPEKSAAETEPEPDRESGDRSDPHSYANADEVRVTHVSLDLEVDFNQQVMSGVVVLHLEHVEGPSDRLVLDTRDLDIEAVADVTASESRPLDFQLGESDPELGAPMTIDISGETERVRIRYATNPGATALQWLAPRMTLGGEHPFLFSQGQAIHTRSWIPLQDTPGVRVTYDATLRVPGELRAVMSAENDPEAPRDGSFDFDMPQAVPPYLIALGVGDVVFRAMSERTGVYAESGIVEDAAAEFEDTERMIQEAVALYGPYRWGRYDLLIPPPSFPIGGMENPRLSFITPTIIAGDKSLVSLIAHELAHSWSGNLVSNATWRDLWLNEGFTTYVENRIMEVIFGEERARMEAALAYQALVEEMEELPPEDELLAIDLTGEHPDEVFTDIPYTKGMLFLKWLEQAFGRETFDAFLRNYFDHFAFQSITTAQFEQYLYENLLDAHPGTVTREQVRTWIHEPGLPDTVIVPESDAFDRVDGVRAAWLNGDTEAGDIDTADWTVHEWLHFLDGMPETVTGEDLAALDRAFDLTRTRNNMIARSWLKLAVNNEYRPAYERLQDFLVGIGRVYLIEPIYKALMESGQATLAREIFQRARPGYHPLAVTEIDKVVNPEAVNEDG